MRIYRWPEDKLRPARRLVAVGGFDGLHLGHQRVLRELCDEAKRRGWVACLVTFEPVPAQVFSKEPPGNLRLTTEAERLKLLGRFAIDEVCLLDFGREDLRRRTAREFLRDVLRRDLGAMGICASPNHRAGSDRVDWRGISTMAREMGMEALTVTPVNGSGEMTSSTLVRERVWAGDLEGAAQLLGRDYTVLGRSVRGKGVGHKLGFATANLDVAPEKLLPPDGVYAAWAAGAVLGQGPVAVDSFGPAWAAAVNIGLCPTLPAGGGRSFEVHVIDWEGTTYGEELSVGLVQRLRGEECFENVEGLRAQIASDVEAARAIATERPSAVMGGFVDSCDSPFL